ncbi:Extracellular matrix protein FRAS1, partial [Stegodyphus mimosarum]
MQGGHKGLEPERDTVHIRITDGHLSSKVHVVNITIKPINDESPHIFTDSLFVKQGGYAKITNSTLFIVDTDTKPE